MVDSYGSKRLSPSHGPAESEHNSVTFVNERTPSLQQSARSLCIIVLLFLIAFQCLFVWKTNNSSVVLKSLDEVNGLVPSFKGQIVRFPERADQSELVGSRLDGVLNNSLAAWRTLLPLGGGFVQFDKPSSQYHLPPPIVFDDGKSAYNVAVFHQLHCLHSLMTHFDVLLRTRPTYEEYGLERVLHADHCFEYIRRSLVCCSDSAFEGQSPTDPRPGTDGTGSFHVCRDYKAIKTWAERNRLDDMDGLQQSA